MPYTELFKIAAGEKELKAGFLDHYYLQRYSEYNGPYILLAPETLEFLKLCDDSDRVKVIELLEGEVRKAEAANALKEDLDQFKSCHFRDIVHSKDRIMEFLETYDYTIQDIVDNERLDFWDKEAIVRCLNDAGKLTFEMRATVNFNENEIKPTPKPKSKTAGYLYLIQADLPGNPCKIGKSVNVPERMNLFTVKLPFDFELLHIISCEDYHKSEVELHKQYSDKRTNGEWFKLSPDDIINIQTIKNL